MDRSPLVRLVKWVIHLPRLLGSLNPTQRAGFVMMFIGLGIALYYLLLYDTSVSTIGEGFVARQWDERVHNLGRMNQRIVGVIVGIGLSIVGAILWVARGPGKVETAPRGG